jgi:hypothetical protein
MTAGWWVAIAVQPATATHVPPAQIAAIAVVAATGAAIASQARPRRLVAAPVVLIALCAIVGSASTPAWAHDPGQGALAGSVQVDADRSGTTAQITVETAEPCEAFRPRRTVARRAGTTRVGPLMVASAGGSCRISGEVADLDTGAWFIYAELDGPGGQKLETWVHLSEDESIDETRDLYQPVTSPDRNGQKAAGAVLLATIAALFTETIRLSGTMAHARGARFPE